MSNLGWLFYKDYFNGIDYYHLDNSCNGGRGCNCNTNECECQCNKCIVHRKVHNIINQSVTIEDDEMLGNTHFQATTTYPGLILGSGNAHELPSIEGQAILGFHFDYTSGLPTIQGSSIKGVLRSAFRHTEYIKEYVGKEVDIEALEKEIFDNGDVFFDAVVLSNGKILGDDFLTPHGDDPLKNPTPLRFIKVLPDVTFRFDFELSSGLITKSKKTELFQNILADLGLGAKTNVGYGKFVGFKKEQTEEEREKEQLEREEEHFDKAIKENSLEKLEAFKRDFPHSKQDVNKAINEIKHNLKIANIKKAFDNLDKTNKKHVESFISKYKENPDAKEFLEQIQSSKAQKSNAQKLGFDALNSTENTNLFKNILHNNQKEVANNIELIESNILRVCKDLNKKKRNKFIKDIKLDKYLGKEFAQKIKEVVEVQSNS